MRSVILGQIDDEATSSFEKERTKCCAVILLGITEVMLNNIASELEESTGAKKADLEKELISIVELHNSLEKITSTLKQIDGIKKANQRATLHEFRGNPELGCKMFAQEVPFLSTSSISYFLHNTMTLYDNELSNSITTSQKQSQGSIGITSKCSKLMGFTLSSLLWHIRSSLAEEREDPLYTLTYGDIKVLGAPLLKLIFLLKSGSMLSLSQQRAKIENQKEYLYQAIVCFKELVTICSQSSQFTSFVEGLASVSVGERGLDNDSEDSMLIIEEDARSIELLMVKILQPLLSDLLALSSHREVEVTLIDLREWKLLVQNLILYNFERP